MNPHMTQKNIYSIQDDKHSKVQNNNCLMIIAENVGLENYNNISVGIFQYFTTPSIKIALG